MNEMNRTMIDAIIKKAEALCPDSLALIGVYGSVITGDEYEKSDLDLMILINDENGWVLAFTVPAGICLKKMCSATTHIYPGCSTR